MPEVDKRVLLYRKLASADDLDVLDQLEDETVKSYGDMPQAAKNYFDKARVKAICFQKGIKTIAVVAGTVHIEPIKVDRNRLTKWRRYRIRYSAHTQRLTVPLKFFTADSEEQLLHNIVKFVEEL